MNLDVGIFRLVDPPQGQQSMVEGVLADIDYPWERLSNVLAGDPDSAVIVRWTETNEFGGTGLFLAGSYEIHISMQFTTWRDEAPFVLAHEIGHLVDRATFDKSTRCALIETMHSGPGVAGMLTHTSSGEFYEHNDEVWFNGGDSYVARVYEAYADQFVAAFAPTLWEGHYPRFVHWTDDHAAIRRLTLAAGDRAQHADDFPPRTVTMTRGKHIDNALAELKDWRRQHRGRSKLTTVKVLAAQMALRSIHRHPVR